MNFPYSDSYVYSYFGKEDKGYVIYGAFVKDEFFATSPDYPKIFRCNIYRDQVKAANMNHITCDAGKVMIHYLYTGEYRFQAEAYALNTIETTEKLLTHHLSNLFQVEMCNLFKLHGLIRLEIEKLILPQNILKSLRLVDSVLNLQNIKERENKTANSREWLNAHLKKHLKDAVERCEDFLNEIKMTDFAYKSPFLEEMGTEIMRIMFDRITSLKAESSDVKKEKKLRI